MRDNRKRAAAPPEGFAYRRLIVKLGTRLLTGGTERLNLEVMASLVGQVAELQQHGLEVAIVSSGAIAAGRQQLGFARNDRNIPFRQVLASVGQSRLMNAYDQLFAWHGVTVAQALLTKADMRDRSGYLNARNTLLALLELGVVPIINENDVVAIDEIREAKFGDNDNLSAMVANLIDANLLVLLSDVAGLYTADPHRDAAACLVPRVERVDAGIESWASGPASGLGTGGMATKIEAAKLATSSGVSVIIADGREPQVLLRLAHGEALGTLFCPVSTHVESRKRWMLSGLSCQGSVVIDPGAAAALKRGKGSLLPAGVTGTEGTFHRGDIVRIVDAQGNPLGHGISNYGSDEVEKIKGAQSDSIVSLLGYEFGSEVVHRNNLALL